MDGVRRRRRGDVLHRGHPPRLPPSVDPGNLRDHAVTPHTMMGERTMGCVVAAMVWTYWLAPLILALTALFLLAFGAWYLKKVVEPRVLRSDLAQATTLAEPLTRPTSISP